MEREKLLEDDVELAPLRSHHDCEKASTISKAAVNISLLVLFVFSVCLNGILAWKISRQSSMASTRSDYGQFPSRSATTPHQLIHWNIASRALQRPDGALLRKDTVQWRERDFSSELVARYQHR